MIDYRDSIEGYIRNKYFKYKAVLEKGGFFTEAYTPSYTSFIG